MDTTLSPEESNALAVIMGVIGSFIVVFFIIAIIWYVLQALGYYKLSKNRGLTYAWIAWIPICQEYLLGDLIGNKVWGIGYANWILLIGNIIVSILGYFSPTITNYFALILITIYGIVFFIYRMTALYRLYQIYSDNAVLFTVLSVIFHFMVPIFIFIIRNNRPKAIDSEIDRNNSVN